MKDNVPQVGSRLLAPRGPRRPACAVPSRFHKFWASSPWWGFVPTQPPPRFLGRPAATCLLSEPVSEPVAGTDPSGSGRTLSLVEKKWAPCPGRGVFLRGGRIGCRPGRGLRRGLVQVPGPQDDLCAGEVSALFHRGRKVDRSLLPLSLVGVCTGPAGPLAARRQCPGASWLASDRTSVTRRSSRVCTPMPTLGASSHGQSPPTEWSCETRARGLTAGSATSGPPRTAVTLSAPKSTASNGWIRSYTRGNAPPLRRQPRKTVG